MKRLGLAALALDWLLIAAAGGALLAGDENLAMLLLAITGVIALTAFPLGLWWLVR